MWPKQSPFFSSHNLFFSLFYRRRAGSVSCACVEKKVSDFLRFLSGNLIIYTLENWIGTMAKHQQHQNAPADIHTQKYTDTHAAAYSNTSVDLGIYFSYGLMTLLLILLVYFIVVSIIVRIHQKQKRTKHIKLHER